MASIEDRWLKAARQADGSIRLVRTARHGNGKRYRVHYIDPDGRQRSRSFADGEKRKAEQFRVSVSADLARGAYLDPDAGKVTLRKYAEDIWLPAQTFGESTRERIEPRLRLHILPQLGSLRLDELARRPSAIQAWLRGMQGKVAASHIKLMLSTLSTILAAAVTDDRIARNPCKAGTVKAPRAPERKIVPWTAPRVAAVRAALPGPFQAMADAGAGLGLRQGEAFGLSPDDVDFLRRVVHVRRQVKIVGGRRVLAPPKGGKDRDVPLPESVALRLSAHLAAYPAHAVTLPWEMLAGKPRTVALMFTKPDGGAIWRNDFNRYTWHGAVKAAGMTPGRETGFHQLRHHYASSLLADGVDIRTLAEYLGHSDPGFTLRVYCHLLPSGADRARRAVDKALSEDSDCPAVAQEGEPGR